jgi:hypothetical protein
MRRACMCPSDLAWHYRFKRGRYRHRTIARGFKAKRGKFRHWRMSDGNRVGVAYVY